MYQEVTVAARLAYPTMQAEQRPLLAPTVAQSTALKRCARGALVCGLIGLGMLASDARPRLSRASDSKPRLSRASSLAAADHYSNADFRNNSIGVYKRTHACANAVKDAVFQQRELGLFASLMLSGPSGYTADDDDASDKGASCMIRAAGLTAANFSIHDVETEKFHTGTYAPHDWWAYLKSVHGPLTPDEFKGWNQFMAYSFGYFVPDLSDRVARWVSDGIDYLAFAYPHPVDNVTMYAALLFNEHTGEINEFHAPVVNASYLDEFRALPNASCFDAFAMAYPVAFMTKNYDALRLGGAEGSALLKPLPWKVSWPTSDVSKFVRFFESNLATFANPVAKGCGDGGHGACPGGRYVEVLAKITLRDNGDGVDDAVGETFAHFDTMFDYDAPVAVRFVETPHAGVNGENWTIADFEAYIEGVHNLYMSYEKGWDRWIDNHIGFEIDPQLGQGFLDHLAPKLTANGVRWHAHLDKTGYNTGSIWTQGVSGLAFEFQGKFDFSYFSHRGREVVNGTDKVAIHPMSMCQWNGEVPLMPEHNASLWGQPLHLKLNPTEQHHATGDRNATSGNVSAALPPEERLSAKPLAEGLGEVIATMRTISARQAALGV